MTFTDEPNVGAVLKLPPVRIMLVALAMVKALVIVYVPAARVKVPFTVFVVLFVTPAELLIVTLLINEPDVGHEE